MATTFQEVDTACNNSQSCFVANSDIQSWAATESSLAGLPVSLVLAQWIAENAWYTGTVAAECNNPGNVYYGNHSASGCGSYDCSHECSLDTTFASVGTGQYGAEMIAGVLNNQYCQVKAAYQQSELTSGGQQLYDFAVNNGFTILSNGTYNAAYALGDSNWDGNGHYESSNWNGAPASSVPGSALIYFINNDGLSGYDYVS